MLYYGEKNLFWSLIIFGYLSFTTVRARKISFNSCECIKFLNIANFHAFHVWGIRILSCNDATFFLHFFSFFDFAKQLFSTPYTSSNLRNQAPLFTELRLLQATQFGYIAVLCNRTCCVYCFHMRQKHNTAFLLWCLHSLSILIPTCSTKSKLATPSL